jgi:hypothetical protein
MQAQVVKGKRCLHYPLLLVALTVEFFVERSEESLQAGEWHFTSATNGTHCSVALQL